MTSGSHVVSLSGERGGTTVPLTRIFITEDGDLVVTDFWEELRALLQPLLAEETP